MKKLTARMSWFIVIVMFFVVSCKSTVIVDNGPQKVPPGQLKKTTGSQSAKPYAPGQQNKKN